MNPQLTKSNVCAMVKRGAMQSTPLYNVPPVCSGSDMHAHHRSSGVEDDSSDESEFSVDYNQEKSLSTRASRATLVTLDQVMCAVCFVRRGARVKVYRFPFPTPFP